MYKSPSKHICCVVCREFVMGGKDWQDMQLGCLWQGSDLITVNGRGHIIYHSLETPQQPKRVIKVSFTATSC